MLVGRVLVWIRLLSFRLFQEELRGGLPPGASVQETKCSALGTLFSLISGHPEFPYSAWLAGHLMINEVSGYYF